MSSLKDKNIIASTYDSSDLINKIVAKITDENNLIIIDEFHNLSKANISDDENIKKLLAATAKDFKFFDPMERAPVDRDGLIRYMEPMEYASWLQTKVAVIT